MKTASQELELKLEFEPADARRIRLCLSREASGNKPVTRTLVSVYFDTPDLILRQAGVSLRVRRAGTSHTQTIKATTAKAAGLFNRSEWEQKIGGPQPDLKRAQGTALEPLLNGHVQDSLRPMFETRIRRTTYRLARDGGQAEIALDQGEVDTGERRSRVCELEFELMRGAPAGLFRLARTLSRVAPLRLAVKAKADRGYELLRNHVDPVDTAVDVHLEPSMTSEEAFRSIGRGCLHHLIANEPAMLAGNGEALHQMRIALRRLRAAISAFSELIADDKSARIKSELRRCTRQFGPARDLDVLVAEVLAPLRQHSPGEPGVARLCRDIEQRRAKAHRKASASVRSSRFRALILDAAEWIEAGKWTTTMDDLSRLRRHQPVAAHAADMLGRRWKKIKKTTTKTLRELSAAERHRLRLRGKKLRYAVEFFADIFPGKKHAKHCEAALASLKNLQDALGGLNDITTREELASRVAMSTRHTSMSRARARPHGREGRHEQHHRQTSCASRRRPGQDRSRVRAQRRDRCPARQRHGDGRHSRPQRARALVGGTSGGRARRVGGAWRLTGG